MYINKITIILLILILTILILYLETYSSCNYIDMFQVSTESALDKFKKSVTKIINANKLFGTNQLKGKTYEELDGNILQHLKDLNIDKTIWEKVYKFPETPKSSDDTTSIGLWKKHIEYRDSINSNVEINPNVEEFTISGEYDEAKCNIIKADLESNDCHKDIFNYLENGSNSCIDEECNDYVTSIESRLVEEGCEPEILDGFRMNTFINNCTSEGGENYTKETDSTYIGPGNPVFLKAKYNILPLSFSDQIALLHDIMYGLSYDYNEGINSDQVMLSNMLFNKEYNNEPTKNLRNAMRLNKLGNFLGTTIAFGTFDGALKKGNKNIFLLIDIEEIKIYEEILNAMFKASKNDNTIVILDFGFLTKYYDKTSGEFNILNSNDIMIKKLLIDAYLHLEEKIKELISNNGDTDEINRLTIKKEKLSNLPGASCFRGNEADDEVDDV